MFRPGVAAEDDIDVGDSQVNRCLHEETTPKGGNSFTAQACLKRDSSPPLRFGSE
jgi:hypothetical protein